MERANRENIQKTIVLGENEVFANIYKIKDMVSGEEQVFNFPFEQ